MLDHTGNRTELVFANQSKVNGGITHVQILWKSKKIKVLGQYLEGSRIFDIYRVQPPHYVTHDNQDELFSPGYKESCIAVF